MVLVSTNTVAKTILLPNPDPGRFLYIVDSTGNANTNNIYVSTNVAGVQICNGYSTIAKAFGAVGYIAYNSNWYAVLNETGTNVWNNVIATNVSTASLSTNYGYFSTISAGTIYGKYVGDGSLLTNLTVAGVTSVLSTQAFYTSSISSANIISQQGYISSLTVDYLAIGYSPGYVAMGDIIATSLSTIAIQSLIVSASNIQAVRMSTGTLTAYGISTNSISSIYSYLSNISTNLLGAVTANITTLNAGTSALAYTTTTGQTNTGSLSNTGTLSNTGLATFGTGISVTGGISNTTTLSNTGLATFAGGIISSNSATANYTGLTVGNGNGWATINSVTGATNYSLLAAAGDTVIRSEGKNLILTSANTANGNASPWPGGICIYGQYTGVNTNTPAYPLDVNGISRSAIPISSICNTTATIGNNGYGIFYYITNSGFNTLIFANAVSPPTPAAGWYISLRNNTGSYLSVSNTGTMTGLVASPFIIPPANTVTLAWDSTPPVSTATFVLF